MGTRAGPRILGGGGGREPEYVCEGHRAGYGTYSGSQPFRQLADDRSERCGDAVQLRLVAPREQLVGGLFGVEKGSRRERTERSHSEIFVRAGNPHFRGSILARWQAAFGSP